MPISTIHLNVNENSLPFRQIISSRFQVAGMICLPKSNSSLAQAIQILADIPDWQKAISDLYTAKWMFLVSPLAALLIG